MLYRKKFDTDHATGVTSAYANVVRCCCGCTARAAQMGRVQANGVRVHCRSRRAIVIYRHSLLHAVRHAAIACNYFTEMQAGMRLMTGKR